MNAFKTLIIITIINSIAVCLTTLNAYQLSFRVVNRCPWRMDIYNHNPTTRRFDHRCNIPSQGSCIISIDQTPFHSGLIKNILGEQATLFEFSKVSQGIFYDISVIPPGSGNCYSWQECFNKSRKRGFNDALNVIVDQSNAKWNSRCRNLFCRWEQCPDAYLWPFDDTKTMFCDRNTRFTLEYC